MTEKEKMIAGELYDSSDPELEDARRRIRDLFYEYNLTREEEAEKRAALLKEMFGKCGEGVLVCPPVRFDYGFNTSVGDRFFANFNLTVLDVAPVTIGQDVYIGPNVTFAAPMHEMNAEKRRARQRADGSWYDLEYAKPITVGNDVWIAAGVIVCGGVTIGDGAVVGAGSVVTRDIPPYTFCAGNPCRVIRKLEK